METAQLKAFVAVVEVGSFTRAAARLGLSQPTVTSRIKALETDLGVTLVERLPAGIQPTSEGEDLLRYAREIIGLHARARQSVASHGRPQGHIEVGTIGTLTRHRLLDVVEFLYLRYPELQVTMRALGDDAVGGVRDGRLDCAFFVDSRESREDVEVRVLCPEPLVLVSGPEHPLLRLGSVTTADLRGLTLVRSDFGADYHRRFERSIGGEAAARQLRMFDLDSVDAAKRSVANGMGIALLPAVAVSDELAAGRLCRLGWTPSFSTYTQVAWRRGRTPNPALRVLVEAATEVLDQQEIAV
jgi:DNA-binding transcriptional LysR family regulator